MAIQSANKNKNTSPGPNCHTPLSFSPVALSFPRTRLGRWLRRRRQEQRLAAAARRPSSANDGDGTDGDEADGAPQGRRRRWLVPGDSGVDGRVPCAACLAGDRRALRVEEVG